MPDPDIGQMLKAETSPVVRARTKRAHTDHAAERERQREIRLQPSHPRVRTTDVMPKSRIVAYEADFFRIPQQATRPSAGILPSPFKRRPNVEGKENVNVWRETSNAHRDNPDSSDAVIAA